MHDDSKSLICSEEEWPSRVAYWRGVIREAVEAEKHAEAHRYARRLHKELQNGYTKKYFRLQSQIRGRAKGKCERCKKRKGVDVHHIIPIRFFRFADDAHFIGNLMLLCKKCHQRAHREIRRDLPLFDRSITYDDFINNGGLSQIKKATNNLTNPKDGGNLWLSE